VRSRDVRRDHVIGGFFSRDCRAQRVTRTHDHSVYTETTITTNIYKL